ncbi:MAG: biotin/lipoyl-binding protein, partial [Hyphomicrobiales bacterium]|nr:biotin/lipoyl-binding protein [Hyphomicrobiales bacterium]
MTDEIRLPDIGDFKDVPIVEVHVKPGQAVSADDILVTLESDKATMDIPAPAGGVIDAVLVKPGDRVSQGHVLATLSGAAASTTTPAP